MYEALGILNIILLVTIASPFILRLANKYILHTKAKWFSKLMKVLHTIHKPAGAALAVSILVHGYLALGGLRLHTGTLAASSFLVTALLGLTFYLTKKPAVLKIHRVFLFVSVALLAIHLLFPWLFGR